jgi:hypothetical protein
MNPFPILLADADWFGLLIAVVMGIVWVLNQVFGKAQPQAPRRPNQPPVRPPQPNANVQQELENFLRRAAQQRAGQEPRAPQPPAAPQAATPTRTLVAPRTEAFSQPLRRPEAAELVDVEIIEDGEGPRGPSVGEHVKQRFETRPFGDRTPQLTSVDSADEQMEQHLHQTFDRQLGRLGAASESASAGISSTDQAATASKQAVSASVAIAALLRDPRSARNAIILQEVLARPESRWGS